MHTHMNVHVNFHIHMHAANAILLLFFLQTRHLQRVPTIPGIAKGCEAEEISDSAINIGSTNNRRRNANNSLLTEY